MWGRDQVNILWPTLFSCIHLLTTPWLWHQPVFPLWFILLPCYLVPLLDYSIIPLLFFPNLDWPNPEPKRAQKGGSTWTCVRVKLCVWLLSLSPDGVCGLDGDDALTTFIILFYYFIHFLVLFFFSLSSSLSGAAGSLWFITTFLIWAYRGYSIYIIQTPCERSIFTFPSLWIKHLCPFLLDCIPIGQEPHHLLSIAWLYLHLLIENMGHWNSSVLSADAFICFDHKKKKRNKTPCVDLSVHHSLFPYVFHCGLPFLLFDTGSSNHRPDWGSTVEGPWEPNIGILSGCSHSERSTNPAARYDRPHLQCHATYRIWGETERGALSPLRPFAPSVRFHFLVHDGHETAKPPNQRSLRNGTHCSEEVKWYNWVATLHSFIHQQQQGQSGRVCSSGENSVYRCDVTAWANVFFFVSFIDDLPLLVRKDLKTASHRRPPTSRSFPGRRSRTHRRISEMGGHDSLHHPSQPERYSTGPSVYLPPEKIQLWGQGQERQRVSVDDGCVDARQ